MKLPSPSENGTTKNYFEESPQCQYILDKTAIQSFNTTGYFGGHRFANEMP